MTDPPGTFDALVARTRATPPVPTAVAHPYNAISPEAAAIEGIGGPVAGRAHILVAPDLEAGTMLAKSLSFLMDDETAGIVPGARVHIVLTSRAESVASRLASCAVGVMIADQRRKTAAAP